MPLRDHFHAPLKEHRPWEGVHSRWASAIVDQLNGWLPPGYFATPQVHRGRRVEIDVATFEDETETAAESGGVAVATQTRAWAPARPTVSVPVDAASFDTFEVQILNEAGLKLVAAIELVSPANKDRPDTRRAFAVKCVAYLQQEVSVIVVDPVTDRVANLHHEMLDVMLLDPAAAPNPHRLSAIAYRVVPVAKPTLQVWLERLAVGEPLPTLPLWLNPWDAVPVDLEASYTAACRALRIAD